MENVLKQMSHTVLPAYGLEEASSKVEVFGSGLINRTWKVTTSQHRYILQKVNHAIFEQPAAIAHNIRLIAGYLEAHAPGYLFVSPLLSEAGTDLVHFKGEGFYRLFPFVEGSHSKETVETPEQAYEAALHFGRFTRLLSGLDITQLQITIPHFHDLAMRYRQFEEALQTGSRQRIADSRELIARIQAQAGIVDTYLKLQTDPGFKLRVTHHDTKISNVLFNDADKVLCVIDLDTVMPGYFISDVGDMMRTYLSPVSEEERDLSRVQVRDAYFKAIVDGYDAEMRHELTAVERQYFVYAGKFMIYMQALRFLTDYINEDAYYAVRYPSHNLDRAMNQLVLLERLVEKETALHEMIR